MPVDASTYPYRDQMHARIGASGGDAAWPGFDGARRSRGRRGIGPPIVAISSILSSSSAARRGVEAFIEPRTTVTETTVVLVAHDGEWTRRRVDGPEGPAQFAHRLAIPVYDVAAGRLPAADAGLQRRGGGRPPALGADAAADGAHRRRHRTPLLGDPGAAAAGGSDAPERRDPGQRRGRAVGGDGPRAAAAGCAPAPRCRPCSSSRTARRCGRPGRRCRCAPTAGPSATNSRQERRRPAACRRPGPCRRRSARCRRPRSPCSCARSSGIGIGQTGSPAASPARRTRSHRSVGAHHAGRPACPARRSAPR